MQPRQQKRTRRWKLTLEQYTIISSHHLQQPVRKSNPRKWNPKASAASSSSGHFFSVLPGTVYTRHGGNYYEQWDEFNSVLLLFAFCESPSSSSLWTFSFVCCRCCDSICSMVNCISFREKSWTLFSADDALTIVFLRRPASFVILFPKNTEEINKMSSRRECLCQLLYGLHYASILLRNLFKSGEDFNCGSSYFNEEKKKMKFCCCFDYSFDYKQILLLSLSLQMSVSDKAPFQEYGAIKWVVISIPSSYPPPPRYQ